MHGIVRRGSLKSQESIINAYCRPLGTLEWVSEGKVRASCNETCTCSAANSGSLRLERKGGLDASATEEREKTVYSRFIIIRFVGFIV